MVGWNGRRRPSHKFLAGLANTDILEAMSFARLAEPAFLELLILWIAKDGRSPPPSILSAPN